MHWNDIGINLLNYLRGKKKCIYHCFTWICVENCNKPCLNSSSLACPTNVTHTHINTCFLNSWHSSGVRVSAFAMRGMTLTLSWSLFMNSMSSGFRLKDRQIGNVAPTSSTCQLKSIHRLQLSKKSDWCDKLNRFIITEKAHSWASRWTLTTTSVSTHNLCPWMGIFFLLVCSGCSVPPLLMAQS